MKKYTTDELQKLCEKIARKQNITPEQVAKRAVLEIERMISQDEKNALQKTDIN